MLTPVRTATSLSFTGSLPFQALVSSTIVFPPNSRKSPTSSLASSNVGQSQVVAVEEGLVAQLPEHSQGERLFGKRREGRGYRTFPHRAVIQEQVLVHERDAQLVHSERARHGLDHFPRPRLAALPATGSPGAALAPENTREVSHTARRSTDPSTICT